MEKDIINYLIKNSTFIKNNMMNKVDEKLNLIMLVFIILNEDDLSKKQKSYFLLKKYVNDNKKEKSNNDEDFLNIISTINMFIGRVYGSNLEIGRVIEKINSYKNYLIKEQKVKQLRIS